MKRILLSLLAGVAVFGAVFGFAAAITPTSDNLGAGQDAVETCDDALTTSYTTAFVDGQYEVTHVVIGGINSACASHTIGVTLTGTGDSVKGDGKATLAATPGATQSIAIDESPLANEITGVDVVVHNGSTSSPED